MKFMEIVFSINSSQFKDIHTLSDKVFENFRQVLISSSSSYTVFVQELKEFLYFTYFCQFKVMFC